MLACSSLVPQSLPMEFTCFWFGGCNGHAGATVKPPNVTKPRRFPPPWSVDDLAAAFIVRDRTGQALAYVYFEQEPGRAVSGEAHPRRSTLLIARLVLRFAVLDRGQARCSWQCRRGLAARLQPAPFAQALSDDLD